MFEIELLKEQDCVLIINRKDQSSAKINLKLGGSVQELILNGIPLIIDLLPKTYGQMYASSILFPFSGRIKRGSYTFSDQEFQFKINDLDSDSAIHGLIFDKKFEFVDSNEQGDRVAVRLRYEELNEEKGFPYPYAIELTYTLCVNSISLEVNIENLGEFSFPYSIGWHPYFHCTDRRHCYVEASHTGKGVFDDDMIFQTFDNEVCGERIELGQRFFDDNFKLRDSSFVFHSSDYSIKLSSSVETNYLHVYTPEDNVRIIALEPMTAPPGSLNNQLSLNILEAKQSQLIEWTINLLSKHTQ